MKKIFAYIVLIFFGGIWIIASNRELMKLVSEKMYYSKGPLSSDKYRYGDLYGMSYQGKFRDENYVMTRLPQMPVDSLPRTLWLDAVGDSYLYSFLEESKTYFSRVKDYRFTTWHERNSINLPPRSPQRKIFLFEIVERNLFTNFRLEHIKTLFHLKEEEKFEDHGPFLIESNIDFLLFDHKIFTPIKELKSQMLLELFGKIPGEVSVAANRQYLYLKYTLEGDAESNSFYPIKQEAFRDLESRLNEIDSYLKSLGYDEVWLFVAPNPVRVLGTEGKTPNRLFELLGQSKTLKMKFISILPVFSQHPERYYHKSDSHWNDHAILEFKKLIDNELKHTKP